jgi:hypothetical protein
MLKLFANSDVFTLTGDPIDRVQQVLDVARHQIRLGQHAPIDYRMEAALAEAEEAIANARALVADAIEAAQADKEASGEAEHERQAWLPLYRAA